MEVYISELVEQDTLFQKLMRAINEDNFELVKTLTSSNHKIPTTTDSSEDTLIHIAVRKKNTEILDHILSFRQIDINAINGLGKTPLMMAINYRDSRITKVLIKYGADLNLGDYEGNTPLHRCAYYDLAENCLALLQAGADVNKKNKLGLTAFHVVCGVQKNIEIAAMLMYYGADLYALVVEDCNDLGYTPFEAAIIHSRIKIQDFLINFVVDEREGIPMRLDALITMMENGSSIFMRIIDHISNVLYKLDDLSRFLHRIPYFKTDYLRIFLKKFGYVMKDIVHVESTITLGFQEYVYREREPNQLIENSYLIFSEPVVSYFITNLNSSFKRCIFLSLLQMYEYFKNTISEKTITDLIFHILSYGAEITEEAVEQIFCIFGDTETFRILLHLHIKKSSFNGHRPLFPSVIYNMNVQSINDHFLGNAIVFDYDVNIFEKMLGFFAGRWIGKLCMNGVVSEELFNRLEKMPNVPSLVELARNSSRSCIINHYNIRDSAQFYLVLQMLPISNEYKAIISFRKRIYFT